MAVPYRFRTNPPNYSLQTTVRISTPAWTYLQSQVARYGYTGRSIYHGTTKYLLAVASANPTTDDYTDTRPLALRQLDQSRLRHRRFLAWSHQEYAYLDPETPDPYRKSRRLNTADLNTLTTLLLPVANCFLIAPSKSNQLNPRSRCVAVIEAIGLQYLTPNNPPTYCQHAVSNTKANWYRRSHRAWELVF